MGRANSIRITAALTLGALWACDASQECERSRMKVSRTYNALTTAAQQRKLSGQDVENWAVIENKSDLLQSAFATRQVTWASADKARNEIAARLGSMNSDSATSVDIFKRSAAEAFQDHDSYAKMCR
jgi:hypothetical protein